MKGNHIKKVLISAATIAACSILTALPVYADDTYSDDVWAYRAVANVVEAVNIRAAASEDSTIVGYLTTAASADVIERGETWSLVISGGVEGYVRNDCLAFGEDAKNLAGVYGSEGVKTYWDGVSLFAAPDGSSPRRRWSPPSCGTLRSSRAIRWNCCARIPGIMTRNTRAISSPAVMGAAAPSRRYAWVQSPRRGIR